MPMDLAAQAYHGCASSLTREGSLLRLVRLGSPLIRLRQLLGISPPLSYVPSQSLSASLGLAEVYGRIAATRLAIVALRLASDGAALSQAAADALVAIFESRVVGASGK